MMKKKGRFKHSSRRKDSRFKKKNKEEIKEIICFECRKPKHMKVECPQLKKKGYSRDKKKSLMVTWDDSDSEKSSSSDDKQPNLCLTADTNDKVEVKICSESYTSSCDSLDDEEDMPYDILLQCKNFKEKFKVSASKNTELKKSNVDMILLVVLYD